MPDQPDDPIHYDMKIPPEPQDQNEPQSDAEQNAGHRDSDDVARQSNRLQHTGTSSPTDMQRRIPGSIPDHA